MNKCKIIVSSLNRSCRKLAIKIAMNTWTPLFDLFWLHAIFFFFDFITWSPSYFLTWFEACAHDLKQFNVHTFLNCLLLLNLANGRVKHQTLHRIKLKDSLIWCRRFQLFECFVSEDYEWFQLKISIMVATVCAFEKILFTFNLRVILWIQWHISHDSYAELL